MPVLRFADDAVDGAEQACADLLHGGAFLPGAADRFRCSPM
jgi:hypothetical protein